MSCRSGIGTTIAFATSSDFTPRIRSYNGVGIEREVFECTHMGSAVSTAYPGLIMREYMPGDLGTPTQMSLGLLWDIDDVPDFPMDDAPEQITITFKIKTSGNTSNATLVFNGFVVSWSADIEYDSLIEGTCTLQPTGDMVATAEAA